MSADPQRDQHAAHARECHANGICEFSGLDVLRCVRSICDCFETEEGARAMKRGEHTCEFCKEADRG